MAETSFHLNNEYNKCIIDSTEIISLGGPENPKLQVPMNLDLSPGKQKQQINSYILLSVEGKLKPFGNNAEISSGVSFPYYKVFSKYTYKMNIEFPLTPYQIMKLEEKRVDSFKASINLTFRVAIFEDLDLTSTGIKREIHFIAGFESTFCDISIEIPQSQWITKLLPNLGFNAQRIYELPATNNLIPEEYSQSLKELDSANEYMLKGDYDKVVSHCRNAIEPIKKKLPELKGLLTSKSAFEWIDNLNESTYTWLDKIIKGTASFTSKTHHTPSMGHFARHDAQIVLMITTGIIGYAGKCLIVKDFI